MNTVKLTFLLIGAVFLMQQCAPAINPAERPRVIATTDGEIDDECSMVRFLLYANEWDVEGIVTSSSQYHWAGHRWAGNDWMEPYLNAYAEVYPNLKLHDRNYPTPEYLRSVTVLGNINFEGDMEEETAGSNLIANVLLDETDNRPVWLQAWGGVNTIARALKTIEEKYPEKMQYVADKARFYFIWEQDSTYQHYIRPVWGKYNILTIISDQFEAIAYRWTRDMAEQMHPYFEGAWMQANILENHGALCSLYKAHENGDFRSEGDSPAFMHTIPTGLRNAENPDWGGWGGRYIKIRENTWLDPVPEEGYVYPEGRWWSRNAWGRASLNPENNVPEEKRLEYFKPIWRWSEAFQNDFAARAGWCIKPYAEANHPPVVQLKHAADLTAKPGEQIQLNVRATDPDGNQLTYRWWHYTEAGTYAETIAVKDSEKQKASLAIPENAKPGDTIHLICEVADDGSPRLSRYQRVVISVY